MVANTSAKMPGRVALIESPAPAGLGCLKDLRAKLGAGLWRSSSDCAQVVASYLACHPKVSLVRYPGLRADALYAEASCALEAGFGPLVWFSCSGGEATYELDCTGAPDARELICDLEAYLAE